MRTEFAASGLGVEMPVRLTPHRHFGSDGRESQSEAFRHDDLGGTDAFKRGGKLAGRDFADTEVATRKVDPGQAGKLLAGAQGEQQRVALLVEQGRVGQGARRDDACHRALDRPLAGRRIADLLADHDGFTEPDQLRQILFDGVVGYPGHLDRLSCRLAACRQRNVQQPRRFFRVVEEQFVKVAHPVKQQDARMFGLDAQVLLHHRGMPRYIAFSCVFIFRHMPVKPLICLVTSVMFPMPEGSTTLFYTHLHLAFQCRFFGVFSRTYTAALAN